MNGRVMGAGADVLRGSALGPGSLAGVRVAVTGASGFCGGAVARAAAAAGADVVCVGRRPGPVGTHRPWDAGQQAPDLTGADVVVHLAAAVGDPGRGRDEASFEQVNVAGAQQVLDAAGARPVVWVSSASVYDPRVDRSLVREDHPTAAGHLNAYGRTKAAGDRAALAAGAVVLRPHAVYGPGDRHLLPRLRRALRGGAVTLPGPDVSLSLTAVENLAVACLQASGWPAGAYNIADTRPYSRDVLVGRVLQESLGRPVRVRHVPLRAANGVADLVGWLHRLGAGQEPVLTRYAVDQLAHDFVLDTGRARAAGWSAHRDVDDYLATLMPPSRHSSRTAWGSNEP